MKFMDKKEQVLDIKLTPYGKHMLAKGKMKPVYYAFFDDNVLYNSEMGGIQESQSEAKDRIRKDTPQLETQSKFTSDVDKLEEVDFGEGDSISPTAAINKAALSYPLSNGEIGSQKMPSITLQMWSGNIDSYNVGSYETAVGNKSIDQINTKITFKNSVKKVDLEFEEKLAMDTIQFLEEAISPSTKIIQGPASNDGEYLEIKSDYILADIFEKNVDFDFENFDIEVFRVVETPASFGFPNNEYLAPLTFAMKEKNNNIINNILIDEEEDFQDIILNPNNVEYYFHIYCDSDIDEEILEENVSELKSRGFFTGEMYKNTNLPKVVEEISDIYGTNITSADIKECD